MLYDAPNGYDPTVAFLGSIMFCAIPLYYLGFWVSRKLRWKTLEPRTIVGGVISSFAWFTFFMFWLGPVRGLFFAVASLIGWALGFWLAARRNEQVVRSYYGVRRSRPQATGAERATEQAKEER